jgi:zinc transport system ATP-binding protein
MAGARIMPPLISLRDICVTLGGNAILRNLSASIVRGQITALIGLNGSGKTTLLRTILQEVPHTGSIQFHCGHDHTHGFPKHIGYVPQRLLFDTNLPLTVCELLTMALRERPLPLGIARPARDQVHAMLKRVWAEHLLDYTVGQLSGGELQRVLLALALEPLPELLLLDEPAAGIDFRHQGEFYRLIRQVNEQTQVTVVLVSHDLSVVTSQAHHVLCLSGGRIECEGPPREILSGEMVARIFGVEKSVYAHHQH